MRDIYLTEPVSFDDILANLADLEHRINHAAPGKPVRSEVLLLQGTKPIRGSTQGHCATARIAFLTSSDRRCQFVTSSDKASSMQIERRQGGGQLTQIVCEGKTCGI